MHYTIKYLVLFCLVLSISACGFHPRGPVPLAPPLHNLYLKTAAPYGRLAQHLRELLKISGVHLTTSPSDATTVLTILSEVESRQLLSVSTTQQTRQYNLILSVTFQVESPRGQILVAPQVVHEVRAFTVESSQILADSNEANKSYRIMREAIAYSIMNVLASQNITRVLMSKP